ncbi:hypothetical protein OZN62_08655 [Aurantiacibacter sp. MUD11]|uniref:hypothetical protein n=1 Tax=Aurantiacibacter sp. MUD11 TaxID=3003265 RepID=UPI0022AABECB|nr:hypothetical protein [Aurantiacibacter sp. MUD11]WAT17011.1 hypothetical protein OZN62_08655 [Aurantiacibacter sp. MUD11]
MPSFRFCLEGKCSPARGIALDLPDESVIALVAKQAARQMASRELEAGQLSLARHLVVFDSDDAEVARFPLSDFVFVG